MNKDLRDIGHATLITFIEEIARYHIDGEELPVSSHVHPCEQCDEAWDYYDAGGPDVEHDLLAHIIITARALLSEASSANADPMPCASPNAAPNG